MTGKMLYKCEKCKNIVQVLCHLVKGENNFTFEFLGVKVQESKKNKNLKNIHSVFKDRLHLYYEPRQSDFKVQLVYIVCRWKWKWFKYDKVLCYLKEMILKMLHQGPRWQFPGPGRYNWEVGGRRQTTSSGWTSSSDCRGWDNAGDKYKDKHNHRDKHKNKHKDNQREKHKHTTQI